MPYGNGMHYVVVKKRFETRPMRLLAMWCK